jgi:hypothetical protein
MAEYAIKNEYRKRIFHLALNMLFFSVSLDRYVYIAFDLLRAQNKKGKKERNNTRTDVFSFLIFLRLNAI